MTMRRKTVQFLVALALLGLVTHIYFNEAISLPAAPDWLDIDYTQFDLGSERGLRPYPPPPRPKTNSAFPLAQPAGGSTRPNTLPADERKRDAVVNAFRHAWSAYEHDAFGYDEYHPIGHRGSNLGSGGGIGYTVVDAIDTMLLMGLTDEYERAREWVEESLSFARTGYFSTFETTIRVLGGLLSAYHLTGDELYLKHATDLGERMLPAFKTASGLPLSSVNLGARTASGTSLSISEVATLQLEFRYLAQATGRAEFWYAVEKVMQIVNEKRLPSGLAPYVLSINDGSYARSTIRMGSNADSYYEYLLKQYLQTDRTEEVYHQMYTNAMDGIQSYMIQKTSRHGLTYIAELLPKRDEKNWRAPDAWAPSGKQEHLACFLAGSLMLGATTAHLRDTTPGVRASVPPRKDELTEAGWRDWTTGAAVLEGCMATHKTATGLSPEGVNFRTPEDQGPPGDRDWYIKGAHESRSPPYDARYMLRPEISESVFLAWRLTGDAKYRVYAWQIFSAIERYCRVPEGGYATVQDVDSLPVVWIDKQETFFLSETLKYLFLTFADESVIDLHEVVFNTEAHPLPVFRPTIKPKFTEYE